MSDHIKEAIIEYWCERCNGYEEGCPVCEAWKEFDALESENAKLRQALRDASYSLFQVKRMPHEAVREFASSASSKACAVLDECDEQHNAEAT